MRVNHTEVSKQSSAIKHVKIAYQTSKQTKSPCLIKRVPSNRPIKRHIFPNKCSSLILKIPNGVANLWTHIFHMRPHSISETRFLFGEKLILEKSKSPLILFFLKRKNKTRKKNLKKWLHSFGKSCLWKPKSRSGDQVTYWKGTSRRQHPFKSYKGLYWLS